MSRRIAVGFLLLFVAKASAARLFIDSRPTNLDPNERSARLIFREMPRQALIVAATEDFAFTCADPTVEPTAAARDGDVRLGLDAKFNGDRKIITLSLWDAANQPLDNPDIDPKRNDKDVIFLDDYAAKCDELVNTKWEAILAKQLNVAPKLPKWDVTPAAAPETEKLLATFDFQHAYLAARANHLLIAKDGESPARLSALVRAYANLGDATRQLVAGQSHGFFARSLMYAQRLVRLAPNDALSWRSRAYAETLFGISLAAAADFKHADDLGAKDSPAWVDRARDLLAFRTVDLFQKSNGPDAALTSYFAFLSVEHSMLPSLTINFARVALEQNPGAVRLVNAMTADSGVILNHQTTVQSTLVLNRLIATLPKETTAPKEVQDAAQVALGQRFSMPSILKLLATVRALPDEPAVPLQWSTFASLVTEAEFVNAVDRLTFVTEKWGVDPTQERDQWLTLLGDHRYVVFLQSFRPLDDLRDPQMLQKVQAIEWKDDALSAGIMQMHFTIMGIPKDVRTGLYWNARERRQSSYTTYETARAIWNYSWTDFSKDSPQRQAAYNEAQLLNVICPNHPLAIAMLLLAGDADTTQRTAQIEKEMGENPLVAYALGQAYENSGKHDEAIRLLQQAVQYAPDKPVYSVLAAAYLAKNDEQSWLNTWNKYLKDSEDFSLDHSVVCEEIARHFMDKADYQTALPYAESAAQTGSSLGFQTYGQVLRKLKKYDEAAEVMQANAERYGSPESFYRFVRATGHGDLKTAVQLYEQRIVRTGLSGDPNILGDIGVFYYLESQPDKAREFWTHASQLDSLRMYPLQLAMLEVEQNHLDGAKDILNKTTSLPATSPRDKAYAAGVAELLRCLNSPDALPSRDGEIGQIINDKERVLQRANICYFLGRLCELRNHPDDAKWWYRTSLESNADNFTCQPMSAVALRRLGEEYFK